MLLAADDEQLSWLLRTQGYPPLWSRPATFATLIQIILEQQVSLASAAAIYQRMQQIGAMTPANILQVGPAALRECGLTRQKTRFCLELAAAIDSGQLRLSELPELDDAAAMAQLTQVTGIGPWTARVYLLMGLGRVDIWPQGDLALNAAARDLHGWTRRKTDAGIARYARRWKPYRSVAARMLWQHYLNGLPTRPD